MSTKNTPNTGLPEIPALKESGWGGRIQVGPLDRDQDAAGNTILRTALIEEGRCVFILQRNLGKVEGSSQPDYHLARLDLDEEGEWDDPLLVCSLWRSKTTKVGAEAETYSAGTDRAKTVRYSIWKDRDLPGEKKGHTLYRQEKVDLEAVAATPDDFLD